MASEPSLPPLPSEQLLIDALDANLFGTCEFDQCLVVSPGRGQAGWHAKTLCPSGNVTLWFVDAFRAAQAQLATTESGSDVTVTCSADLPEDKIQLALVAVLRRGEAEMTRDLLQQAHDRLDIGGRLIAAVNNPKDHWLQEQLQLLFDKVNCRQTEIGWVYSATKQRPLKKHRNFDAEFMFRDEERLVRIVTRPSVFSHRSLDVAARLLVSHSNVQAGDLVLDFGCGSGAVGIATAIRLRELNPEAGHVYCVDCNARAVQCAERGAALNGLTNVTAILNHDGVLPDVASCDLALLNPPYYGSFTIAEHFMYSAAGALKDEGRAIVVTKQLDEYHIRKWPKMWWEGDAEASGFQLLTYRKRDFA